MVADRRRTVVRYPPAKLITPLDNPDPIQGWVERKRYPSITIHGAMGFEGLNPPYGPVENPLSPSEPLQRSSVEPNVFDLTLPSSLKNSLNSAFIRSAHFFTVRSMPLLFIVSGLSLNMI
jgi:hypothetical protein